MIPLEILAELQDAVAAKDLDRLGRLFDEDVVVFGTAAANVGRAEAMAYLELVLAQEGTIRWAWDDVLPVFTAPGVVVFVVIGSVGFDGDDERDAFRLTCVAVEVEGTWRIRHFHGSVPQTP